MKPVKANLNHVGAMRRKDKSLNDHGKSGRKQHYESNGPIGRVRGDALQVADKYKSAGIDAELMGNRVKAESCFQYAEHYYRLSR